MTASEMVLDGPLASEDARRLAPDPLNPLDPLDPLDALAPERFGFAREGEGWIRDVPGMGSVAFAPLAWPHAQVPSYDGMDGVDGVREPMNALGLVVRLQQKVWGFPPDEAVPVNVLSILEDTGGGVMVAYDRSQGFNADGWLGFAIGMGTRSGVHYSHMLGVREDRRGALALGWYLKVLQGYEAVRTGHHAMTWTYDPMRGANARLNLEKLAAPAVNLTIDKYGVMRSTLYGDVPTDRFTARWDLLDPAMHARLHAVLSGSYRSPTMAEIADLPELTVETAAALRQELPERIRYEIPGDIDRLAQTDPERANRWRQEMRQTLGALMTTRRAHARPEAAPPTESDPIAVGMVEIAGPYIVTAFASERDGSGNRASACILTRQPVTADGQEQEQE